MAILMAVEWAAALQDRGTNVATNSNAPAAWYMIVAEVSAVVALMAVIFFMSRCRKRRAAKNAAKAASEFIAETSNRARGLKSN